ncbi:MAG: cytochrome-c peroxidase [Gammaproteobacteria bacterium]
MNKVFLTVVLNLLALSNVEASAKDFSFSDEQELGKALFQDKNLSLNRNQSCASCHSLDPVRSINSQVDMPVPGFVDPDNVVNKTAVSGGSILGETGTLNAPSIGYAAVSPFFHWDGSEGLYVGGQFWNGRANTLAEQAKAPFLNPVEMAMPNEWAVVSRLRENRQYVLAFVELYDLDLKKIPPYTGFKRIHFAPPGVMEAYDKAAQAIAAFEKSREVNKFTAKFDFYQAGMTELTELEAEGLSLFEGRAQCSACHVSQPTLAPDGSSFPPLLTDFTYDNIGLPQNKNIPTQPEPGRGLGGREDIADSDPDGNEIGKHKVMSLRNIEVTPPYGHNGVFRTLEQIVHFYNTRDTLGWVEDNNDPGFSVTGWPSPEVSQNVNTDELGHLGLTPEEELALVAFLKTLTDGYPDWGNDPRVPKGTPSPYQNTPFPPIP